ncbi:MAG TPA: HAMP domain-containing sensor histidine kinase [Acidimicrobiia bacterium]|nr:HAMP domain-containing sensor histidine kinase [Acidimicrobiia bacterium]
MSFKVRLTLLCVLAVAVTVVLASVVSYFAVSNRLHDQTDDSVRSDATRLAKLPNPEIALPYFGLPTPNTRDYMRVTFADGRSEAPPNQPTAIPESRVDISIAHGTPRFQLRDAYINGRHLRIASATAPDGRSVQFAQDVDDVDATISDLRTTLLIVGGLSILVAALLALIVARASFRPVARLTRAAERVATTQDLAASIDVRRRDELGRLASSINAMLDALSTSREQQRELIRDASHELQTPLTSLQTNVEVLASRPGMPEPERRRLLADVSQQVAELSALMDNLVELARDSGTPSEETTEIDLDRLVGTAVDRARLRAPDVTIELDLEPTRIDGRRRQLERALVNVLDNACKWSPPGGTVEVGLCNGTITVRDHGPGIDTQDLPRVFDRFYRSAAARAMPGSGLGLAIVRRVVDGHGGSVTLGPAPGGGTIARIHLPTAGVDYGPFDRAEERIIGSGAGPRS